METGNSTARRSGRFNMLLLRVWFPFLAFIAFAGIVRGNLWAILCLALPALFFGLFLISLAEVRAEPNALYYRRAWQWRQLDYADVLACRRFFFPFIASIKSRRSIFPWGRLYFVLDSSPYDKPFRRPETLLVSYINGQACNRESQAASSKASSNMVHRDDVTRCITATCAGLGCWFLGETLFPSFGLALSNPEGVPVWLNSYSRIASETARWPWSLLVIALVLSVIFVRRFRKETWALAFAGGLLLPWMLLGAFKVMPR